jgi:hypothetical protein
VDNHIAYLTPMERTTEVYQKEHTHYVVATSIPQEWNDKVLKVTIEPAKGLAKELLPAESRSWESVEKQLDEELKKELPNPYSFYVRRER